MSGTRIQREQIIACLRQRQWKFQRRGKHVEIWKHMVTKQRLDLPTNHSCDLRQTRAVLQSSGMTLREIEAFLLTAEKDST